MRMAFNFWERGRERLRRRAAAVTLNRPDRPNAISGGLLTEDQLMGSAGRGSEDWGER
jgi:enoyl-CoA hydratase/carnithine racemase